jgi:periplasmic protein CpxP/Spy
LVALLAGLAWANPASAQLRQSGTPAAADSAAPRELLMRQVRHRWMALVQARLQLNDAQIARLKETNRHFGAQRSELNQAERGVRQEMRDQLTGAATADDKRLSVLIDSLLDIQRQRLEIIREEQHELSQFMTPLQRVRYLALQEQLRQRIEALRQRAGARHGRSNPPDSGF